QELRAAAAFPEDAALQSQVVQDGRARLATTSQACFRRLANGEKAGFPRCQGRGRSPSVPSQEEGNGAQVDNGCLLLAKRGRSAVRWSRPVVGTSKTLTVAKEAGGW